MIHAGEKLRESKKKMKMASSNSATNRDWGKVSMECLICNVVGWSKTKLADTVRLPLLVTI